MKVSLENDEDEDVSKAVMAGLKAFNDAAVPDFVSQKIVASVRDDAGKVVGGVVGRLSGDSVYMDFVYNDESVRGTGFGSKAMRLVEEEAKRLGANEAWLYTMSFQAKPFYEKLGYSQFGELNWLNKQHKRHFMRKDL